MFINSDKLAMARRALLRGPADELPPVLEFLPVRDRLRGRLVTSTTTHAGMSTSRLATRNTRLRHVLTVVVIVIEIDVLNFVLCVRHEEMVQVA